ncbi:MAG: DUF2059 domain-containing protein [Verrucomicrobiales bacterium]|nr:DUF2059 domain-containing protein [Verrucomicrobiota bacterium JB025]
MKTAILLIICLGSLSPLLPGQDESELTSHQRVAEDLLISTNSHQIGEQMSELMFQAMFAELGKDGDRELVMKMKQECVAWSAKVFKWEEIRMDMIKIYTDAFTEDELRELIAFYTSGVGRKSINLMPELMQKGAMVGQKRALLYQDELRQRIEDVMAEHLEAADDGKAEKPEAAE